MLGSSLKPKSDKNVLEVVIEKDTRGAFVVKELECANMMRRMSLDQRPGVEVEEVQICLHSSCQRSYFYHLQERSIRSVMVKPAGKIEVIVTIKGIHPNTREEVVLDYLDKFGKICCSKSNYGVFNVHPLNGFRNGDRS